MWILCVPAIAHLLSNALAYILLPSSSIPVKDMINHLLNSPIRLGLNLRLIQQVSGQNPRLFTRSQETRQWGSTRQMRRVKKQALDSTLEKKPMVGLTPCSMLSLARSVTLEMRVRAPGEERNRKQLYED